MTGSTLQDLSSRHHKIEAYVCKSCLNIMKIEISILLRELINYNTKDFQNEQYVIY